MNDVVLRMFLMLKNNVEWISQLFTILFTAVATIVGVLTYQKAKKSLLQPVKSEVIKRQTKILTDLLSYLFDNNGFDRGFDYEGIVYLSTFGLLRDYGFIFKDQDQAFADIKKLGSGLLVVSESNALERFEKDQPIVDPKKQFGKDDFGKKKFRELKKGIAVIDVLYLTRKHDSFKKAIKQYAEDPFMPTEIADLLKKVLHDSSINTTILIKESLRRFFLEYSKHYFAGNRNSKVSFGGVWNIFNEKRISHKHEEDSMRSSIRKFMRVDEGWV